MAVTLAPLGSCRMVAASFLFYWASASKLNCNTNKNHCTVTGILLDLCIQESPLKIIGKMPLLSGMKSEKESRFLNL